MNRAIRRPLVAATITTIAGAVLLNAVPRGVPSSGRPNPPTKSDPCRGQHPAATQLTKSYIMSLPEGTTFCLKGLTYKVPTSLLMQPSTKLIGRAGTVLDFADATLDRNKGLGPYTCIYGYEGFQDSVTVRNVVVRNCAGEAIKTGASWDVQGVDLSRSDIGIRLGIGSVLHLSRVHHNAIYGVVGSSGTVRHTEVDHNGGTPDPGGSTGGSKSVLAGNFYWLDNYVHDNRGPGIWTDGHSGDFVVSDNRIEDNTWAGIDFEISWHGSLLASGNTLKGNDTEHIGKSCFWSAQIEVQNSQGVVVVGNIIDSSNGANAICVIDTKRDNHYPQWPQSVQPFLAVGNDITMAGTALVGEAGTEFPHSVKSVRFASNTYHVASATEKRWVWLDALPLLTLAQWQELGQQ